MAEKSLAGLDIDDLIAQALATNDDDDDDLYWAVVHELHRRGDDPTFEAAGSLCIQTTEASQCLGLHILAQLGYQHDRPYLEQSLPLVVRLSEVGQSPGVLSSALGALGHLQDDRGLDAVLQHARHPDAEVRLAVAQSIPDVAGELPGPEVVAVMLELMRDPEARVRDWATFGLGKQIENDSLEIREALFERLDDDEEDTAGEALVGLARRNDPRSVDHIIPLLEQGDAGNLIVEAAQELADPRCLPALYALREEGWERDDPRGELLASAITVCEDAARES